MVYVDLAHAVVDQLDLVNIADVTNTQYRNILNIVNWFDANNWKEGWNTTNNRINSSVPELKALFCGNGNTTIESLLRSVNISSTNLDDDLVLAVKQLLSFFPVILEKIKSDTIDTWSFGYWSKPFEITNYIKNNRGIIGRLLNYKMKDDVGLFIRNTLKYIMDASEEIVADMKLERVFESLSKSLAQVVFLTTEDQKRLMEPIKELGNILSCLYCNVMLNIFKVEVTCSPCEP